MKFQIYIPSKGRAGKVTTHKLVNNPIICVPKNEVDEYRKYHEEVMSVPNSIYGITATRNYILDNAECKNVIMIDDDAVTVQYHENGKKQNLKPNEIDSLFENGFDMCDDVGTNLFGYSVNSDRLLYRYFKPIYFCNVIVGNMMGIVNDGQRFDENLKLKEDYDFFLQTILKYKYAIKFTKYFFSVKHLTNSGGCVDYRTKELERESIKYLQSKWGKSIIKYDISFRRRRKSGTEIKIILANS